MKHTPGNWVIIESCTASEIPCFDIAAKDESGSSYVAEVIEEGDANLIAAAPALLEALEWVMKTGFISYSLRTNTNKDWCDRVDACKAAIAKAKGET